MSAETLRRAAADMRAKAGAATPGPWVTEQRPGRHRYVVRTEAWREQTGCRERVTEVRHVNGPADAAHIASWHPAVALAVADWLDMTAQLWTRYGGSPGPARDVARITYGDALAVARAYLAESTEAVQP